MSFRAWEKSWDLTLTSAAKWRFSAIIYSNAIKTLAGAVIASANH
jgi:hypothetical protein